jgi:DNA-binding CsgD family transcriptional regulator
MLQPLLPDTHVFATVFQHLDVAIILLNGEGRIRYSNAAAQSLLEEEDGLRGRYGRLLASSPGAQARLARLINMATAFQGTRFAMSLPRQPPASPLFVRLIPAKRYNEPESDSDEARVIVFISNPNSPAGLAPDDVMQAFGLTPSEKTLLHELLTGRTLQEAANHLKIARATSRNRLARIMAKTETHRQSELLQLMLRCSVPVR